MPTYTTTSNYPYHMYPTCEGQQYTYVTIDEEPRNADAEFVTRYTVVVNEYGEYRIDGGFGEKQKRENYGIEDDA